MNELVPLSIANIACGQCLEEADKALKEAISHCERFPSLKKPRIVVLEIHIEPDIHKDTGEYAVDISSFAVPKLPKIWSPSDRAAKKKDGYTVIGNPQMGPLEADQMSLAEAPNVKQFPKNSEQ